MDFGIPYFHTSGYQLGPCIFSLTGQPWCQLHRQIVHASVGGCSMQRRDPRDARSFCSATQWLVNPKCWMCHDLESGFSPLLSFGIFGSCYYSWSTSFGMFEIGLEANTLNCWQMLFHMFLLKSVLVARCCCSVTFMGSLSFLDTQNSSDDASIMQAEKNTMAMVTGLPTVNPFRLRPTFSGNSKKK